MRLSPTKSLRGRLLLLALLVEATMLILLISNSIRLLHTTMGDQAKSQAEQLAPILNAALVAPLAQYDYATVQAVLDESYASQGLAYLAVLDRNGSVVAAAGWDDAKPLPQPDPAFSLDQEGEMARYDVARSIDSAGQQLGTLRFGLSLDHIIKARHLLLTQGIAIALGELCLSAALLAALGYLITRQLMVLTKASRSVAEGNLTPPPVPEGEDEIGRLGAAFNVMSEAVAERIGELTEARNQLLLANEQAEMKGKLFQEAVNSISQGFLVYDQDDRLLTCNDACIQCYPTLKPLLIPGTSFEQMIRAGVESGIFGFEVGDTEAWIEHRLLQHHEANGVPFEQYLSDGRCLLIMEFRTPSGYVVGNRIDISAQKQGELILSAARDAANAANKAKSLFLANMSHEIRTPMNAILGFSQLCLQTELNVKQKDYVSKIQKATTALLGIINDILDFSKIEAGKLEVEKVSFNLEELISNVTNLFLPVTQDKRLSFSVDVAGNVPNNLMGDSLRLGQILTNLLSNSVKFTEAGFIKLSIQAHAQEASPKLTRLSFVVEDSGIGMSESQLSQLFKEFSQADNSITRKYGGTGLGLTICRELVALMAGSLNVVSHPGQGTRFEFDIPFEVIEKETSVLAELAPRILVVDDDDFIRAMLVRMLGQFGCLPVPASSGQAALDLLTNSAEPFALVLLDWRMPGMDGLETADRIKALPGMKGLPIMLITAASVEETQLVHDHGIQDVLFKPIQHAALYDAIHRILATRNQIHKPANPQKSLKGARVLLVEDNEFNQQVATELLEAKSVSVSVANNGLQALQMLEQHKFDLVLMDMQMPVMDGISATRAIREIPRFDRLPVIAMTANALPAERQQCFDAGMNDFITKPVLPEMLYQVMTEWLGTITEEKSGPDILANTQTPDAPVLVAGEGHYFDVEKGMIYSGGKAGLYARMVQKFAGSAQAMLSELQGLLLQTHKRNLAIRAAHGLKGVAATLGAEVLAVSAAELEKMLKEDSPEATLVEQFDVVAAILSSTLLEVEGVKRQLIGES